VNTRPKTAVVKIGGSTLGAHDTSLQDLVALQREGRRVVVVHGGGAAISDWLRRLDTPTRFVRGLRVTDEATLDAVVAVLGGIVNKQLVASISALGGRVCGICGADGATLQAVHADAELGFVGTVTGVDLTLVNALLDSGLMPVIAPIAIMVDGESRLTEQLLNINADAAAGELALALQADQLVFLTDVDGVRDDNGALLRNLNRTEAEVLLASGVISGGMIPKAEAGLRAAASATCVIADGRRAGTLRAALGENPPGTVIDGVEL
jgi:acetylglutamate kinase